MLEICKGSIRAALQVWGRFGKAPGWRYRIVEKWGPSLAPRPPAAAMSYLPNGLIVQCDLRDFVQRAIYFWGCYETVEAFVFTSLLRPGMVVVDAGANVGNYTLLAAEAVGLSGHVHAFEPIPSTYQRLVHAIADNALENVTANNLALWDEQTVLELGLPAGHQTNMGAYSVGSSDRLIRSSAVSLDHYLDRRATSVDLVKIDVEGAEMRALRGMRHTLERHRPLIFMEVNSSTANQSGWNVTDLGRMLINELGYKAWILNRPASMNPAESLSEIYCDNILFFHGDVPDAVRNVPSLKQANSWARCGKSRHTRPLQSTLAKPNK